MDYKSVIENVYVHLANGDRKPIFDLLASDALWIESENLPNLPDGPIVGHEAIQKAVFESALAEHWTELRINPVRVVAAGTTVLAEGRYVGTTKAGEKLDAIFAHVWDFDGDLIVRVQQYSDTWQFHHVLGLDA